MILNIYPSLFLVCMILLLTHVNFMLIILKYSFLGGRLSLQSYACLALLYHRAISLTLKNSFNACVPFFLTLNKSFLKMQQLIIWHLPTSCDIFCNSNVYFYCSFEKRQISLGLVDTFSKRLKLIRCVCCMSYAYLCILLHITLVSLWNLELLLQVRGNYSPLVYSM